MKNKSKLKGVNLHCSRSQSRSKCKQHNSTGWSFTEMNLPHRLLSSVWNASSVVLHVLSQAGSDIHHILEHVNDSSGWWVKRMLLNEYLLDHASTSGNPCTSELEHWMGESVNIWYFLNEKQSNVTKHRPAVWSSLSFFTQASPS